MSDFGTDCHPAYYVEAALKHVMTHYFVRKEVVHSLILPSIESLGAASGLETASVLQLAGKLVIDRWVCT